MGIEQALVAEGLRFGPLGDQWVHLYIDMQRMFADATEWYTPWMGPVLPNVVRVVELDLARTIFTRFIPPQSADQVSGTWRRYYQRWETMTRDRLAPGLIDLVPELDQFVPPAQIEDKHVMSAGMAVCTRLRARGIHAIIVTGAETEVFVLATVMGAIDLGYRVIIVIDAVCSGADTTHDAMLEVYRSRFGMQVETVITAELTAARIDGML